jgi:hypothetical protein
MAAPEKANSQWESIAGSVQQWETRIHSEFASSYPQA